MTRALQADRFREIFLRAHAGHAGCANDEWSMEPCRERDGSLSPRPLIWSRRNGPWKRVRILWVGAAPGNAGGLGKGPLGAHGTRIPFGGDIAGANLEVLMASAGVTRNQTFIVAALNQLPARGGGEPRPSEIMASVGQYSSSLGLLRDTLLACGPSLVIALGNTAMRALIGAVKPEVIRLPGLATIVGSGFSRHQTAPIERVDALDPAFRLAWSTHWGHDPLPHVLWTTHPSAQNMSPYAGEDTTFHARMLETRSAIRSAVRRILGVTVSRRRARLPRTGIYALPEWRTLVAPRLAILLDLWRARGL